MMRKAFRPVILCAAFVGTLFFIYVFSYETTSFEQYLEEAVVSQDIPGLSILVFDHDDILFEEQYGYANREENLLLDVSHRFLLASISKTITATALMQLVEQGKVNLDENINQYLPFEVTHPFSSNFITPRMLLTHTASIADGSALDTQYYNGKDSPIALEDFLASYFVPGKEYYNQEENFYAYAPGENVAYSNTGSALITVIVEQVTGMDFADYCDQYIFDPLEMHDTVWHLADIKDESVIAHPHVWEDDVWKAIEHYTFTDYPNGGLRSTAQDLHRFLQSFLKASLLSQETIDQIFSLQIPALDTTTGLHWFLLEEEYTIWGHDGSEKGVSTIMGMNLENGVGVIVLSNGDEIDLDEIFLAGYVFEIGEE